MVVMDQYVKRYRPLKSGATGVLIPIVYDELQFFDNFTHYYDPPFFKDYYILSSSEAYYPDDKPRYIVRVDMQLLNFLSLQLYQNFRDSTLLKYETDTPV